MPMLASLLQDRPQRFVMLGLDPGILMTAAAFNPSARILRGSLCSSCTPCSQKK